jgi:hypothetical protein
MWSKELTKLSRRYFETGCCCVKSENGEFGNLIIENQKYKISLFDSDKNYIFNSVDEIIKAGWAVD